MSVDFNGSHSSPRPDSVRKAEPLRCWALTAGPWLRPPTPPILAPQRSSPRLRIRPAEGRSRRWSRRPPSSGAPTLAAPPLSCPGRAPRGCIRAGGRRRTWSAARGLGCAVPAGEVHALRIPRPRTLAGPGNRSRAGPAHSLDARATRQPLRPPNPDQPPSPRKVGTKHYSPCSANLHGGSRGSAEIRALQPPRLLDSS